MLTIPSLSDAPRAWAALPDHVRAEARQYADRFEGHPDPAVAAVVVGQIRAEADLRWRRDLVSTTGLAVFVGTAVADFGRTGGGVVYLPFIAGVAVGMLTLIASRWRARQMVPHRVEAANLRVFLSARTAAVLPDPGRVRRYWSRIAVVAAVFAVVAPTVAWLAVRAGGEGFDPSFLRGLLPAMVSIATVVNGSMFLLQYVHRPKYWAKRVTVTDDGVRFGRPWVFPWTPTVPWADVVDVDLDGPTPLRPRHDNVTVWQLRDGTRVRVVLKGSRQPPEEQILAARSRNAPVA